MIDIDAVSRIVHVPKSTLRYWESEGLIASARGSNNYRRYHERDVIDIGDVALYRKLGVGVRDIANVRMMGEQDLNAFLDGMDESLAQRIGELRKTQSLIRARKGLLQEFHVLKEQGPSIVSADQAHIGPILAFDLRDECSFSSWIEDPHEKRYCLLFESPDAWPPKDGWIAASEQDSPTDVSVLLWAGPLPDTRFARLLFIGENGNLANNNLQEALRYVATQNATAGRMVARYLLNIFDEKLNAEAACYELLIELR